jgi:DNA-binding CsgD family transcriptional regulator
MLHGRDGERAAIDRLLAGAVAGRSGALVISGEPGMGKTALLDYAASAAGAARLLRTAGVESEAELPFAGLQLLLRPALDRLDALPEVQATALRGALGLAAAGPVDRFLVGLAVLCLLSDLAGDGPLVCLVDDAQWLDEESLRALRFTGRRLDAEGVVLLFGVRDGTGFTVPDLPALRLRGLDAPASAALLAEQDTELSPGARTRLLADAGGNPLALIELPAALGAARSADLAPGGTPPLTERLRIAFGDQVRRLPESTQTVLRVAAAADTDDLAVVLRAAAGLGASVHDLTPAQRAGLVRLGDGTVAFRHPLLRAAVHQETPLGQRLALHRALAEALDGAEYADQRAWHLAAATTEPDEQVAAELERTAARAGSRSGHAAAAAAYERAVRLTPDPTDRIRRLILAAEAAGEAGSIDAAVALAGRVTGPPADPLLRARLTQVQAFGWFSRGQPAEAYRLLSAGGRGLVGTDAHRAADMLVEAAYIGWFTGKSELADAIDQLAALRLPPEDRMLPIVRVSISGLSMVIGRPTDDAELDKAFTEAERASREHHRELVVVCGLQLATGQDLRAHHLSETLVAESRTHGRIGWLPNLLFIRAETQLLHGQHRDAAASVAEASRIAADTGQQQWTSQLTSVLAYLAAIGGDERRCRELTEPALGGAQDPGLPRATWALGLLDLGLGRAGAALDRLVALASGSTSYGVSSTRCVPDLVEAAVRAGEPARATEPLRRFSAWAERTGQSWARALVSRCEALLAPGDQAERYFQDALERHRDDHRPFDQARTDLLYGEWLRRERRKAEANTHLRAALATFQRLDAFPWADRAATEVDATGVGGTVTAAATGGVVARLTPQELQIVRLAARGLSNRDIAAQLFLSPRTVGHHLYKAYPKLGVLSRGELPALALD